MGNYVLNPQNEFELKKAEKFLDKWQGNMVDQQIKLIDELGISPKTAGDIMYCRSRSWHTRELENKLIELDYQGKYAEINQIVWE